MNIEQIRFTKVTIDALLQQMKVFFQNTENDFDERWEAFKCWSDVSNPISGNCSVLDGILFTELVMYDQFPFYPERGQLIKIAEQIDKGLIKELLERKETSEEITGRVLLEDEVPLVAEELEVLCKEQLMKDGIASFTYDW